MASRAFWRRMLKRMFRLHGPVKSFENDVEATGSITARVDAGARTIPTEKVVGSVNRWRNLRSDFFYRTGDAMTERYKRIGDAMRDGVELPPVELYRVQRDRVSPNEPAAASEYYVLDGHHRVAMARKLGQHFLDANVVDVRVAPTEPVEPEQTLAPEQSATQDPLPPTSDSPISD